LSKARKPAATSESDFGALPIAARQAKGDAVSLEETMRAGVKRARVETQTMLDRYHRRGFLTSRQYDAGQRLHGLWYAAGRSPTVIGGYGIKVSGSSQDIGERHAAAWRDLNKVLRDAGKVAASVLAHVVFHDFSAGDWSVMRGMKKRQGITELRLALDSLARYWRI